MQPDKEVLADLSLSFVVPRLAALAPFGE